RILVPQVNHAGPDLDAAGPRGDGGQQREGRRELRRKVVHAEERAIRPHLFGGDRQLNRLQQRGLGGEHHRAGDVLIVAEREETDLLHHYFSDQNQKLSQGATPERNERSTDAAEPGRTSVTLPARTSVAAETPPR